MKMSLNIKATISFLGLFGDTDSSETMTKMIHFSHVVYILHIPSVFTAPHTQHFCHLLINKVANNIQDSLHSNADYQDNITESEK